MTKVTNLVDFYRDIAKDAAAMSTPREVINKSGMTNRDIRDQIVDIGYNLGEQEMIDEELESIWTE